MPFNSSKTGSTDLRLTEVQQPNTAETLSLEINSRAFSANSGQLEAGSTMTGSNCLPSNPPFLFCSSISMSMASFRVVSLIAIVPDSECRIPTLIVSAAAPATEAVSAPTKTPVCIRRRSPMDGLCMPKSLHVPFARIKELQTMCQLENALCA